MQDRVEILKIHPDDLFSLLESNHPETEFLNLILSTSNLLLEFLIRIDKNQHSLLFSSFLNVLYENIDQQRLQQKIFVEIEFFKSLLEITTEILIIKFPELYSEFESKLYEWISHPSTIIGNFALIGIMQSFTLMEDNRISEIVDSIWKQLKRLQNFDNDAIQRCGIYYIVKLVAFGNQEIRSKLQDEIRSQNWKLVVALANNIGEDLNLSSVIRDAINEDSSSSLHIIYCNLLGKGYDDLTNDLFKAFVSKIWATNQNISTCEQDCMALLKYCNLESVKNSFQDLDILKSVFATLNICIANQSKCCSKEYTIQILNTLDNLWNANVPERLIPKYKSELNKLLQISEKDANPIIRSLMKLIPSSNLTNFEQTEKFNLDTEKLNQISQNLVCIKNSQNSLEITSPIVELQRILGLPLLTEAERKNKSILADAVEKIASSIRANSVVWN